MIRHDYNPVRYVGVKGATESAVIPAAEVGAAFSLARSTTAHSTASFRAVCSFALLSAIVCGAAGCTHVGGRASGTAVTAVLGAVRIAGD